METFCRTNIVLPSPSIILFPNSIIPELSIIHADPINVRPLKIIVPPFWILPIATSRFAFSPTESFLS